LIWLDLVGFGSSKRRGDGTVIFDWRFLIFDLRGGEILNREGNEMNEGEAATKESQADFQRDDLRRAKRAKSAKTCKTSDLSGNKRDS
jgi:hypothetical protein